MYNLFLKCEGGCNEVHSHPGYTYPFERKLETELTMPRLDLYHHAVKRALQKDHWTITHDPFLLQIGTKRLFADLGAECLISAEKGLKKSWWK